MVPSSTYSDWGIGNKETNSAETGQEVTETGNRVTSSTAPGQKGMGQGIR